MKRIFYIFFLLSTTCFAPLSLVYASGLVDSEILPPYNAYSSAPIIAPIDFYFSSGQCYTDINPIKSSLRENLQWPDASNHMIADDAWATFLNIHDICDYSVSYPKGHAFMYEGVDTSHGDGIYTWFWTDNTHSTPAGSAVQIAYKVTSGVASSLLLADYSLPIDLSDFSTTTSLFDHDATSSQMTRYDGTVFYGNDADIGAGHCVDAQGCYDGHHGIDFGTNAEGKNILAAASGTVETLGWENPSNHNQGYGYRMRIYHPQFDQSTIYAHATTTSSFFSVNDTVNRGDTILLSGATGSVSGPTGQHLHFGVTLGDTGDASQSIDPFGWSATTTDPRTNNKGYLWRTNPPSL
ncbi:MAG: M23 family metallopeptidase [Candidatus Paceibacterota bacterium]